MIARRVAGRLQLPAHLTSGESDRDFVDSIDEQPNSDLQSQLAEHQAIRQQLRITWNVFFAKFGRLRDVQ